MKQNISYECPAKALISVIVPCFNSERTLPKCLDSLLKQTIANQIEVIVVNDGSTDKTQKIAENYARESQTIRVINKENEGLPQARKTGVQYASGAYIGFVDSDDWVEPTMYKELLSRLQDYHADIVCCGVSQDDPSGKKSTWISSFADGTVFSGEQALRLLNKRKDIFPYMWNKLYCADLFDGIVYPTGTFVGEDYAINAQILQKVQSLVICSKAPYHYVQTFESVSRGSYNDSYRLSYKWYKQMTLDQEKKFPQTKKLSQNYAITEYLAYLVAMARGKNFDRAMENDIQAVVRKNLLSYLSADYVEGKFKLSALVTAMSIRLAETAFTVAIRFRLV